MALRRMTNEVQRQWEGHGQIFIVAILVLAIMPDLQMSTMPKPLYLTYTFCSKR